MKHISLQDLVTELEARGDSISTEACLVLTKYIASSTAQLHKYYEAALTADTLTISNMDRFDSGFRDRLAQFFLDENKRLENV